jgi:hypothetical protein
LNKLSNQNKCQELQTHNFIAMKESNLTIEQEAIKKRLIDRIAEPRGKYIDCDKGWYKILEELNNKLAYLDPDYQIYQIKEKFGTLRVYYETTANDFIRSMMDDFIIAAEKQSAMLCEICGNGAGKNKVEFDPTVRIRESGRIRTLCDTCVDSQNSLKL